MKRVKLRDLGWIGLAIGFAAQLYAKPRRRRGDVRANLLNRRGRIVMRVRVPRGTPFLINLEDGHYYDLVRGASYVRRIRRRIA